MKNPPKFLENASAQVVPLTGPAQAAAQHLLSLRARIASLEESLSEAKAEFNDYQFNKLPDLMDQAGIDRFGLPAQGNEPAYDIRLTPYYRANIAADWPEEKRKDAFNALTDFGSEDLIKAEVIVALPRGEKSKALELIKLLEAEGVHPSLKENVHWQTLTAWLKEQFEAGNELPPLDVIGAQVGRIATLKERK